MRQRNQKSSASDPERSDSRTDEDNLVVVARVQTVRSETEVKKMNTGAQLVFRKALSMVCALLVLQFGTPLVAQELPPSPEQAGPPAPALSPDQLANLVAPIALYPDSLLSQVLVAATYPLEVVEAGQWLQQNRNLRGAQLVEAARQQNWDASIQALVVFPDVMDRLSSNVRWTTDLGNAFLAQQADVMDAVQHMRAQARAAGKLNSNPQETVTTQTQGGQTAIEIQPANPQVVYVPAYNPEYIWGPPLYGYYPGLYYPQIGYGFGFGLGVFIGGFFGGLGWGGWGWGLGWFGHSIFLNNGFFNHYGYSGFRGGGSFQGRGSWAHDPGHRLGVPYSNNAVASRFSGASSGRGGVSGSRFSGQGSAASRQASSSRMNSGGNFGNRGSMGTNSAAPRSFSQQGAGSRGTASSQTNSAQGWQRFSGSGSGTGQAATSNGRGGGTASGYRSSTPAYSTNGGYRSSSSYGGSAGNSGGGRAASSYRPSSPAYSTNGGYRSSSSYGGSAGNSGGGRAASSYRPSSSGSRGGGSSRSGGGSVASHSSGGGGGSHSGGGGQSSHSSGGGGGHHR
jgi:hypothetical protein